MQRSISNANLLSNTGLGPIQRGNIVGTGVPIARTPSLHSASSGSLDLMRPYTMGDTSRFRTPPNFPQDVGGRLSVRTGSHQSLFGSTESLDRQHSAFARNLQARYQPLINLSDDMELRQRGPATIQPSVQEYSPPAPQQRLMSTPKANFDIGSPFGSPKAIKRKAPPPPPPHTEGLYEYPLVDILPTRPPTTILKTLKSLPRRFRGMSSPRGSANLGENMPLLTGGGSGGEQPKMSLGRYLNMHKRKLIVGGAGVLGGAAIVGGTVAGILSGSTKREKTVQGNESRGMFEQLSTGSVVSVATSKFRPQPQAMGQLLEGKSSAARSAPLSTARKPKRASGMDASGS